MKTRIWRWMAALTVAALQGLASPAVASVPLELNPLVPWSRGCGHWPATDLYRFDLLDDRLRVTVEEPGKGANLNYPVALSLNPFRTPLLTVTYRAEGLRTEEPGKTVLAFWGGEPNVIPVLHHRDLVSDGAVRTMSIDLRDVLAEHNATPAALERMDIRVHAGKGEGVFDLLGVRFDPVSGTDADEATVPTLGERGARAVSPDAALKVRVVDGAGQPVPDAVVVLDPHLLNLRVEATTDAAGRLTLRSADAAVPQTRRALFVTKPGHAEVWLRDLTRIEPTEELRVMLAPEMRVGGRVVDESGEPVVNARGEIWLRNTLEQEERARPYRARDQLVFTDDNGRWESPPLPDTPEIDVQVRWMDDRFLQDQWGGHYSGKLAITALRKGDAESVLRRGAELTGVVTDQDGNPVAGAHVAQGDDRFPSNAPPATKTDTEGRYRFENVAPGRLVLTVTKKGQAPDLVQTEAAPGMSPVDFALGPAALYRFRVVDQQGEAIANAGISADTWRGFRTLAQNIRTNAKGEATWHGPHDSVQFDVYARDFMRRELTLSPNDPDRPDDVHEVVMAGPLDVTLRVTDAETGEPVPAFAVITGVRWDLNADRAPHWQRDRHDRQPGREGVWQQAFTHNYPYRLFRVEVDGYRPAVSEPIAQDAGRVEIDLELTPAEPVVVQLTDATGSPAIGVPVYVALGRSMPQVQSGKVAHDNGAARYTTDERGRFTMPPLDEYFVLYASNDAGYVEVDGDELAAASGQLTLTPWARITGRLLIGDQPAAGERVGGWPQRGFNQKKPRPHHQVQVTTDAEGTFVLDRVVAGDVSVGRYLAVGPNSYSYTNTQRLMIEPGQSYELKLGGAGRPVVGQLAWADADDDRSLRHGHRSLRSHRDPSAMRAAMDRLMPEGFNDWEPSRRESFMGSDAGKAMAQQISKVQAEFHRKTQHFNFAVEADGTFRVDNVGPGEYVLSAQVAEPPAGNQCGFGDMIGRANHRFTVPELPDGVAYVAEPLELGTVTVESMAPTLGVGDAAPDFTVPVIDADATPGTYDEDDALDEAPTFTLSEHRGRVVLIDFWAVWCGPCKAETPNLKAVWDAFGDDDRFAMIGLSLDPSAKAPFDYARKQQLGWTQGFLGNWNDATLPRRYGVRGIPSIWLIGPDGRVLKRDLRGGAIEAAVQEALKAVPELAAR